MSAVGIRAAAEVHCAGPIDAEHLAQMTVGDRGLER